MRGRNRDLPKPPDVTGYPPERALELMSDHAMQQHEKLQQIFDHLSADVRARGRPVVVPTVVVAQLTGGNPEYSPAGSCGLVFVSNESGGAVLAFSDGAAWRRSTDRAVVS